MWWILPLIAIVVIVAVVWWRANKHTEQVRRVVDPIKLKLPIFGKLDHQDRGRAIQRGTSR